MSEKDWSMHIVREEHWAANGSHAYMVEVSAGLTPQKSHMRSFNCCKEEVHCLLSLFSRYGCPG